MEKLAEKIRNQLFDFILFEILSKPNPEEAFIKLNNEKSLEKLAWGLICDIETWENPPDEEESEEESEEELKEEW